MGYALIWIESLASALLFIALLAAGSARWSRPLYQRVGPISVAALLAIFAALLTWAIGFFQFSHRIEFNWFSYFFVWSLGFVVGTMALFLRGFKRQGDEGPRARTWSRPKLAVALGALVLLTWTTFSNMDLAIKIQMSAVRAEAGARILAQMPQRVPDRDNAAFAYQEAFAQLTPLDKLPERWKPFLYEKSAEAPNGWRPKDILFGTLAYKHDPQDKELPELLASQERALALFRQAAALPACWFEHDYFKFVEMLLPEIDHLRQGALLLGMDAQQRAARGDTRGALDDVAAMLGIARHVNDPTLITFLVSSATEKAAAKVLENVLSLTQPTPEDLARLKLDDRVSFRRDFHRACVMEEAGVGLSLYALVFAPSTAGASTGWLREIFLPQNRGDELGISILLSPFYRVFFLQDDVAGYRRAMKRMQTLAEGPYSEAAAKEWQAFDRALVNTPPGIFAKIIIPAANRCAPTAADADAAHRLSRLALAMTSYRASNKNYPAKLDDLVPRHLPSIPLDPFDGQPLRMKRDGKDVLLYSVSRNFKDDGGTPGDVMNREGDIVFRLRGP